MTTKCDPSQKTGHLTFLKYIEIFLMKEQFISSKMITSHVQVGCSIAISWSKYILISFNFLCFFPQKCQCTTLTIIAKVLTFRLRGGSAMTMLMTSPQLFINRSSTRCTHHTHGADAQLWRHQHTLALPLGNLKVKTMSKQDVDSYIHYGQSMSHFYKKYQSRCGKGWRSIILS